MTRIARYWRAQPLYLTLLFAALVMRGLIPAGYMPAPGHGLFALELCTAQQYRMPIRDAEGADGAAARSDVPAGAAHVHGHDANLPTGHGQQRNAWFLGTPVEHHEPSEARSGPATAHHHHDGATERGTTHQPEPSSLVASEPHDQRALSSLSASEPHHQHNGATTPGHDSPCPFAATAVCAPAPTIVSHAVALETSAVLASREPQVSTHSLLARSQSARAPPALS
jgi:hypothetical protein